MFNKLAIDAPLLPAVQQPIPNQVVSMPQLPDSALPERDPNSGVEGGGNVGQFTGRPYIDPNVFAQIGQYSNGIMGGTNSQLQITNALNRYRMAPTTPFRERINPFDLLKNPIPAIPIVPPQARSSQFPPKYDRISPTPRHPMPVQKQGAIMFENLVKKALLQPTERGVPESHAEEIIPSAPAISGPGSYARTTVGAPNIGLHTPPAADTLAGQSSSSPYPVEQIPPPTPDVQTEQRYLGLTPGQWALGGAAGLGLGGLGAYMMSGSGKKKRRGEEDDKEASCKLAYSIGAHFAKR